MNDLMTHRPRTLDECKGQTRLKMTLKSKVAAFRTSGRTSGHMLFTGPSGVGKTTFARCFAVEMGVAFHYEMATNIRTINDFLNLVLRAQDGDLIFLDEIHALSSDLQEAIYPVIEDFHYVAYNREGNRTTFPVPRFTLIGATTHAGDLNAAFKTRFLSPFRLLPYNESELAEMITSASTRVHSVPMGVEYGNEEVAITISRLCRRTPRIAYNLLSDVIDTAIAQNGVMPRPNDIHLALLNGDCPGAEGILFLQSIDPWIGLDASSRAYLSVLSRHTTLGERALAAMIHEELSTIKNDIEPFLLSDVPFPAATGAIQEGAFVEITTRGRAITALGRQYLDMCRRLQKERGWFEGEKI